MDDEPPAEAYDPVAAVEVIYEWLDRWGSNALPHLSIPPGDPVALERARDRAIDAAIVAGRGELLRELQAEITEWDSRNTGGQASGRSTSRPPWSRLSNGGRRSMS